MAAMVFMEPYGCGGVQGGGSPLPKKVKSDSVPAARFSFDKAKGAAVAGSAANTCGRSERSQPALETHVSARLSLHHLFHITLA